MMTNDNFPHLLSDMEGTPCLKCDIEIDYESPSSTDDTSTTVANALRTLAAQIEAGKLDDGFHPIKTANGVNAMVQIIEMFGAGEGNRTLVVSFEAPALPLSYTRGRLT
jgi:hypothetical protein